MKMPSTTGSRFPMDLSRIAASLGSATDVADMKRDVASWSVQTLTDRLTRDLQRVSEIAAKCQTRQPLATNVGVFLSCQDPVERASNPTLPAPAPVPISAAAPAMVPAAGAVPAPIATGPPRPIIPPGGTPPQPVPVTVTPQTIEQLIVLTEVRSRRIEDMIGLVRRFASDAATVHTPKTVDDPSYSLKTRTVEVTVAAASKYDTLIDGDTRKKRDAALRKFSLVLKPYSPVEIGVAPALVLLFIDNPNFKAVKSGDSFVIQEEDEQVTGYNLAAMLTMTPRAWSEPTFGGSFHIGLSPTKDKLGLWWALVSSTSTQASRITC